MAIVDQQGIVIMQQEKENYLQISYHNQKGLLFKWNFKDLFQQTPYFHHLFVIRHTDKKFLFEFLSNYYKKMKSGDLFSVIYYYEARRVIKKSKWLQKTQLQTYSFTKLVKRMAVNELSPQIKLALNNMAIKQTAEDNQHFVVNFILQDESQYSLEYLQKQIQRGRKQGGYSYICTYFGKFKMTDISFTRGINYLNVSQEQLSDIIPFYYSYLNNAAIKRAKISLQCTNGQLICNNSLHWYNVDFNRLQKEFYGPSIYYDSDEMHFFQSETSRQNQIQIILHLQIYLFSSQQLSSSKKVRLKLKRERTCQKSLVLSKNQNYLNHRGIWIACNPYSTLTVVRMIKNTY